MILRWLFLIFLIVILFSSDVEGNLRRSKRFTLFGFNHPSKHITYRISRYSRKLTINQVNNTLRAAFNSWTRATGLTFMQLGPEFNANIDIRFEVGAHGHGFDFDGPGYTLAHAHKNYLHFDDDEPWSLDNNSNNINLYNVALHEIGHCLGLEHSDIENAVMWPYYHGDGGYFIQEDDKQGIQSIYKKQKDNRFHICLDPSFDTIVKVADGKEFVFKGDYYYDPYKIFNGPQPILTTWYYLVGSLDAGFNYKNKTYFFNEGYYWSYTNYILDSNFPKLSPFANYLDTAFVIDNKVYLFKNDIYYVITNFLELNQIIRQGSITQDWSGIPTNVDAAFVHNNGVTFYKGNQYYLYAPNMVTQGPYPIRWNC